MSIIVYISTISSNKEIKKQQQHIDNVLTSLKVDFETADVSSSTDVLAKMREIIGDETALVPQICCGDQYLGNYDAFLDAVENKELPTFLKQE